MSKRDLSNAYMCVWIHIEDFPKLTFVIPPTPNDPDVLIGFHFSCPMGYVKNAPLFCATTETIADFADHNNPRTAPHPLDALANSWPPLSDPVVTGLLTEHQKSN